MVLSGHKLLPLKEGSSSKLDSNSPNNLYVTIRVNVVVKNLQKKPMMEASMKLKDEKQNL